MFVLPVAHDELIPALLAGKGDIVAAGTLVTDPRKEQVDFTNPTRTGVSAIAVTESRLAPVNKVEDLAGREVYLQLSMISPQGVERFNAELANKGLPPVKIKAGTGSACRRGHPRDGQCRPCQTTLARLPRRVLEQVFPKLVLNRGAAVKTDGQIAMMIRQNSPQLKAELNAFLARHPGRVR